MTAGIGAADAAIYTGVCVDNNDPLSQGRIKYCVPQLSGAASFGWALPVVQGYTPVGANVFIAFEGGDRNRPLYWPDQNAPLTFPTFSSLTQTYNATNGYPQFGTVFWITNHGGSIQWQLSGTPDPITGLPTGKWQWLPNGSQMDVTSTADASATGTTATRIAYASFDCASTLRKYRVNVASSVWSASASSLATLAILYSTSLPAPTLSSAITWWDKRQAGVGNNGVGTAPSNATYLGYTSIMAGLAVGTVYVSAYIFNGLGNASTVTTSSGTTRLWVEDIGVQL